MHPSALASKAIPVPKPSCFRTDIRFLCRKPCPVRQECLKLVAEWRR
jgi:hypothetical protein